MKAFKIIVLFVTLMYSVIANAQDISLATLNTFMSWSASETRSGLIQWGWRVTHNEIDGNLHIMMYENSGRILCYMYNKNTGECLRYVYLVHRDHLDYIQSELREKRFLRNDYEKNSNKYSAFYTDYSGKLMILAKESTSDPNYYQLLVEVPDFAEKINATAGNQRSMLDFETLSSIVANKTPVRGLANIISENTGWNYIVSNNVYLFKYQDGNYMELLTLVPTNGNVTEILYSVPPESFGTINSEIKSGAKYLKQTTINKALCNVYYTFIKGVKVYCSVTQENPDMFYYITFKLTPM